MSRRLRHFEGELSKQDMLDVASFGTIKRAGESLVINRHTGMWCILSNDTVEVLKGIKNISFSTLCETLGVEATHLERFIIQLYEYGLLSINGQSVLKGESDQQYPLSLLVLKLTNRCNLTCKYCYNEGLDGGTYIDGSHLELDVAFRALESALDACGPTFTVVLHGGEPFLRFDSIRQIVTYGKRAAEAKSKQIHFMAQTNATVMTTEIARYIKTENIGLGISLDGPPTLNDQARIWADGRGAYHRIKKGIDLLRAEGLAINIITVVTSVNDKHLYDLALFFQNEGVSNLKFSYFFPQGRGQDFKELFPSPENIVAGLKRIVDGIRDKSIWAMEVDDIMDFIRNTLLHENNSMCHRSPCGAGKDMMALFPSGEIYACDCLVHSKFALGNIQDTSFSKAASHPAVKDLWKRTVESLKPCSQCLLRRMCGGSMTCRAFWTEGETHTISSIECFVNQSLIEYLMWNLLEGPELMEYFFRFNRDKSIQPYLIPQSRGRDGKQADSPVH